MSEKEKTPSIQPTSIKTLFEWTSSGRPFKKRTRTFFINIILIVLLLEIILFFFHEYMLMLVIVSFLFVTYALNTVPPRNFRYRITTGGITIEDHFFLWQELYDFYFRKRFGNIEVLHISTKAFLPGEITLTLNEADKNQIKSILSHYLPYREIITPTFMDKSATWLTKNFPLEQKPTPKVAS
jgi:predicted DNA binding CopG/RHH family protein